jgi:hypothetical protein
MKLKFIIILLIAAITGMVAPGCVETVPDGANPAEVHLSPSPRTSFSKSN